MESSARINQEKSDERLYTRMSSNLKQRIQHAADIRGLDVTSYVTATMAADAEKTIQEHEILLLSQRDREAFANAIINPPAPSKRLIAAAKRYKERTAK